MEEAMPPRRMEHKEKQLERLTVELRTDQEEIVFAFGKIPASTV
jgi:hypothetical protein